MKIEEIEEELKGFTGTENYYEDYLGILLTDGVKYLAERLNCYWLISDIATIVKTELQDEDFIVVGIIVSEYKQGIVRYENGNDKVLYKQEYKYTDFPEGYLELYYKDGVLMLPSEY